jgi:uncharacterized delta-60 repeat protein
MERAPAGRTRTRRRLALPPRPLGSGAVLVAAMVVAVVFSAGAKAAPGDLDPTFSGDGKQTTDFSFGFSRAAAIAHQPDGKLVAVGTDLGHLGGDFALARYNADGSLDTSFSGDGKQTTDFGGSGGATGVALQGDGKIVAVGFGGTGGDFALARYNADGSLDTSFSGDGMETTDFGGFSDRATGVALQGDGMIVVVGGAPGDFALARYNPNGSLDTSFSGDGKQTTAFGGGSGATGVALQGGKIVAVGSDGGDFALARYNPNGSLDASFSGDGKRTTHFGPVDRANAVALQGDGKIVAVGRAGDGTGGDDFALARYNPNGSLDPSFSGDGRRRTQFPFGDGANGVGLQGDGKIVAVGSAGNAAGGSDFQLARYNPNGSLDTSFVGDGKRKTGFGGFGDGAIGMALQGDGKIVAVGHAGGDGRGGGVFALTRYNANGSLDTSFAGDGRKTTDFGRFGDGARGVALQGDGKIVAVGRAGNAADSGEGADFALARYNTNGSLDTSFSGDGKQTTQFPFGGEATGVALQGEGKIVVVGGDGSGEFALARYNANGSLDTSFSGDGKQRTDFYETYSETSTAVALQGDGKIVAVGVASDRYYSNLVLARYNPNGSLDASFSGDGKSGTSFGPYNGGASAVALQGDGKIVAAGGGGEGGYFALARFNPNGSLDASFSGDGKRTTGSRGQATGVGVQGDGKIVAVGYGNNFGLARFNPNGSLDTSFSGDGKQTTDFGASGLALQTDGKIVAVGEGIGASQTGDFAVARYLGG